MTTETQFRPRWLGPLWNALGLPRFRVANGPWMYPRLPRLDVKLVAADPAFEAGKFVESPTPGLVTALPFDSPAAARGDIPILQRGDAWVEAPLGVSPGQAAYARPDGRLCASDGGGVNRCIGRWLTARGEDGLARVHIDVR